MCSQLLSYHLYRVNAVISRTARGDWDGHLLEMSDESLLPLHLDAPLTHHRCPVLEHSHEAVA